LDQLPRKLGLIDAALIVVGIVIGSGIFLLPSVIARNVPSAPVIMTIWIATGVVSLLGAFAYAELGSMMPATGGQYVFLREAYGPACAFLSAWVFMFAAVPGGIAFLARGFSIYLGQFVPLSVVQGNTVSATLIVALSAINYVGIREGAWTQRIFGSLKIIGLLL
jgi:APA family basic amino acid/polyamine antiporter